MSETPSYISTEGRYDLDDCLASACGCRWELDKQGVAMGEPVIVCLYHSQIIAERDRLRAALEAISAWQLPATGRFWENTDGSISDRPMSYGVCYGSNGERDYMRGVADAALKGKP